MCLARAAAVAHDGDRAAGGAASRQPFRVELASGIRTWDKTITGGEGSAPESNPSKGHWLRGSAFAPKYQNLC